MAKKEDFPCSRYDKDAPGIIVGIKLPSPAPNATLRGMTIIMAGTRIAPFKTLRDGARKKSRVGPKGNRRFL